MGAVWGKNFTITIFGESHGQAVGAVINGLPTGLDLDVEGLKHEMARRAPGQSPVSTPREEKDDFEILSGVFKGRLTGSPLAFIISNCDRRSGDYEKIKDVMRPGHADYTAAIKYGGYNDFRGGGHFSGRITAPLLFAGTVARQFLKTKGIQIAAHIKNIGGIEDKHLDPMSMDIAVLSEISHKELPVLDDKQGEKMRDLILQAATEGDSVGGIVECAAYGLPVGVGEPFFDSVESTLSHIVFSIPAVKGIAFGAGFELAALKGSQANDPFSYDNGAVRTKSNNCGGILGGITNGMPLVFEAVIKPTPSIAMRQRTINIRTGQDVDIEIQGRHDPCIVPRAVPVIEAACAAALADLILAL